MNQTVHHWLLLRSSSEPGMYSILDFGPSESDIRRTRRDYLELNIYPKNALVLIQAKSSTEALRKARATERLKAIPLSHYYQWSKESPALSTERC
ncbi:hypothetical protein [Heliomicrobium modesticaldum]|uniref:hypothetical protein n=1 Tax=Heliomicrobium modesticaldum TaxID=35701 RepID=UPI0011D077B2|nr:hypothetical protein [Heliomicrobium modesticaldum]